MVADKRLEDMFRKVCAKFNVPLVECGEVSYLKLLGRGNGFSAVYEREGKVQSASCRDKNGVVKKDENIKYFLALA